MGMGKGTLSWRTREVVIKRARSRTCTGRGAAPKNCDAPTLVKGKLELEKRQTTQAIVLRSSNLVINWGVLFNLVIN